MPTSGSTWVFAYGSLLWRPGFKCAETVPARLAGWARRFWQGSPDHRGTPQVPGRVVTLVARPSAWTVGLAHCIATDQRAETLARLDVREQGGYSRHVVTVECDDGRRLDALTWIAPADNPHFLGPASYPEMASHINSSTGPSGSNREYFERLFATLHSIDALDAHTRRIARWLANP